MIPPPWPTLTFSKNLSNAAHHEKLILSHDFMSLQEIREHETLARRMRTKAQTTTGTRQFMSPNLT